MGTLFVAVALKAFEVSDLDRLPEADGNPAGQGTIASSTTVMANVKETPKFVVIDGADPRRIG